MRRGLTCRLRVLAPPLPYPLQIGPYTNLFLFNFQRRAIHGVFYPDGKPGLDIDPAAWQCALPRKFPAQLRYMHSELTATLANTDKLSWQPRSGPLTQRQVDELYALLEEAGGGGGGGGGSRTPPRRAAAAQLSEQVSK